MNRQINIHIQDKAGWTKEFNGSRELLSFLENESSYWKEQYESIDGNRAHIHHYIGCFSEIDNAITEIKQWSENNDMDDGTLMNNTQVKINQIVYRWLWSGHPYSDLFVRCNKQHGKEAANAFINFVIEKKVENLQIHNHFFGVLAGYEFLNQDSDILKRRKTETASIDRLRGRLQKTTSEIINEVVGLKDDFNSWGEETRQKWADLLERSSGEHSGQQSKHGKEFASYMKDRKAKIQELENIYQEKLRMEKPAEYWNKAANKFSWHGYFWTALLMVSLANGIYFLYEFYTGWFEAKEIMKLQLDTVQGIVLFGTLLAVYAFLIRVLSRLAFSAFHLMRDAEEREQLTYLYLSLINDKKIDEKSRDIILQALFSRSETGLLTGESAPTMPGVGMSEIISLKK